MATVIVTELRSEKDAIDAKEHFEKVVQEKETPEDIPIHKYSGTKTINLVDLLVNTNLAKSKSQAKQLIEQGGVYIDQKTINNTNSQISIKNDMIIKVGKRKFVKIKLGAKR